VHQKKSLNASKTASQAGGGSLCFLPIERLKSTYAIYRRSQSVKAEELSPMPLRVVPAGDFFEIIDGFKRFEMWKTAGFMQIPVVIEQHGATADHKKLLLSANAPRRTTTALDEACIAHSLIHEDGLSMAGVASLLGHKKEWVARRVALMTKLSPKAQEFLGQGKIGPTSAHHLTALAGNEQDKILETFVQHPLRHIERLALIESYRVGDPADRRELLANPLGTLRPKSSPAFSPRFQEIEHRLEQLTRELRDFRGAVVPNDLPPAEQRRLEALNCAFRQELILTANEITKEKTHDHTPYSINGSGSGNSAEDPGNVGTRGDSEDCRAPRDHPENRSSGPRTTARARQFDKKTRPISGADRAEDQVRTDCDQNSEGDSGAGLPRRPNDSCPSGEPIAGEAFSGTSSERQATFRDANGSGMPS
jgi:ParB-like chromosome segregation protein Spo0J